MSENLEREYEQDPTTGQWRWQTREQDTPAIFASLSGGNCVIRGMQFVDSELYVTDVSLPFVVAPGGEVIGPGVDWSVRAPVGAYRGGLVTDAFPQVEWSIVRTDGQVAGLLEVEAASDETDPDTGAWTPDEPQFSGDADLVYAQGGGPTLQTLTVTSTAGGVFVVKLILRITD